MAVTSQFAAGSDLTAAKLNTSSVPVVSSTADITSPFTGQVVFNTTYNKLYRYTGSAWTEQFSNDELSAVILKTATQSIPNTTDTIVTWSSAEQADAFEGGTAMWVSGNSTQIICRRAGIYAVGAKLAFANNGTGANRVLYVTKNSTSPTAAASLAYDAANPAVQPGGGVALNAASEAKLAVNDILRCLVYQDSGGALNIDTTSFSGYGRFWATFLRS